MRMILNEFNLDEEDMKLKQAILGEDESPIDIIVQLDNDKEVKETSDEISDDVDNMLDIDDIIDKLEYMEDEEDFDEEDSIIDLKIKRDKLLAQVSTNTDEEFDDSFTNINVNLKSPKTLNVDIESDKSLDVNIDDKPNINNGVVDVTLKDRVKNDPSTLDLKLNDNSTNEKGTLKLKLKDKDAGEEVVKLKVTNTTTGKATGEKGEVQVKLVNLDDEDNDKISEFIKKRDELLQSKDPNLMLSSCLKIIVQLKKSLERLINHIPNEVILVRTKYLIGDMLDQIMDNSELILKDNDRLKEIVYKVFSLVISINDYINKKYIELEDKLDDQTKDEENEQIADSLKDAEKKTIIDIANKDNKQNDFNFNINNNNDNNFQGNKLNYNQDNFMREKFNDQIVKNQDNIDTGKRPNINRKRI